MNRDVLGVYSITSAGTKNIDFTNSDTIIINTTESISINCNNITDGELKTLIINKSAGNEITLLNTTDIEYDPDYVKTLTRIGFYILAKGEISLFTVPIHKTFNFSAIPAPETAGEWHEATLTSPWIALTAGVRGGIFYRLNRGYIDISCSITRVLAFASTICTLPAGFRPAFDYNIPATYFVGSGTTDTVINTAGVISVSIAGSAPAVIKFTVSIPLT